MVLMGMTAETKQIMREKVEAENGRRSD